MISPSEYPSGTQLIPSYTDLGTWGGTEARVCGTGGRHFLVTQARACTSTGGSCSRSLTVTPLPVGGVVCKATPSGES